jgi:hypothetical protein
MKIGFVRALLGLGKAGWLPRKEADMIRNHHIAPSGRILARCLHAGFILGALALLPVCAIAQNPTPFPANKRVFSIPFTLPARDVRMVKLYISTNQGATWDPYMSAGPNDRDFNVRVEHDGTFWFAIQTTYVNGTLSPDNVSQLKVQQIVIVDTEPPQINLRSTAAEPLSGNEVKVGVQWDVRDDNLDLNSIRLEGRWPGQVYWTPIQNTPAGKALPAQGQDFWRLPQTQRMEVRLRAMDKAGNAAEQMVTLGSNVGQMTGGTGFNDGGRGGMVSPPQVYYVNKKTVTLEFEIKKRPPSGLEAIELWVTRNRQEWQKSPTENPVPAETAQKATVTYEATADGLYGFMIVARSKAKLSSGEPSKGSEPSIWVEVDTEAPKIDQFDVRLGSGQESRSLVFNWKVTDKNLTHESIILEYAQDQNASKWEEIAHDLDFNARDGTGRYVWAKPEGEPYQFFVRIRAIDRAGNTSVKAFDKPIVFDFTRPEVEIKGVEPKK